MAQKLDYCDKNHPTEEKACLKCRFDKQNFLIFSFCELLSPIPNCNTYSQLEPTLTCESCQLGFFLINNNCKPIQTPVNCLAIDEGGNCTQCKDGYIYGYQNKGCMKPL